MKKYLKNGLSVLTCVAMCVQSPLAVLAEDATEVQNEMQSETPVVQPTDLQTLDQQIATYANESNQSEIFCTVMGDPNLNKEHIESHTKTFVKVKGDDNKDHYKLSEESQQYVDGIYEIRFNDGCIWKLHFDKNGYLNTGWQNDNGSWYYFDPNYFLAIRDTPYQITDESNNTWVYYFDQDGIMQTEYWYPREVGIWSYFDKDGHMVYGWNQIAYDQKDYQTHYFDSEGIELVGWQKIDGKWYYFDKNVETYGIMETGWLLYENTWYYLKATGEMASDEWVDGGKYYVDANGVYIPGKVKVTGSWLKDNTGWWYRNTDGTYPRNQWQYIDGNWYHFDQNGYMQTGWLQLGNTWYYLKPSGAMAIGWEKVGGDWYYLNSAGVMQTGWLQLGNTWYYLNSNGAMQTGWQKIGRDWYYLNASGDMRTGWLQSGNVWYYLKSNGAMATNEWVDGGVYYVDANGIYIPGKTQTTGSWQKDNTGWWYRNADGSYPTDKWEEINSKWYHFNTSGYMETGWITTGDLWYHLAESGELTCGYPNGGETVKLTKTINATCTTDGYQEYTCSKCGETHQVMLPKTGHNYQVSKKVDATCTADGYDVYTCSNCKDTYTKTTQQKLGHDFSKKIDHKDSTCTVKGFDLYQCSRCDETKKTELALVEHNYQLSETVKATCTENGYKEYTCSMCNKSYQEKLPKTGHNYQVSKKVDATCTADGYDVYTCSNCKDTYTKTTQQKLGHDFSKKIDHKDSTCTVKGFDLYQCSRCNETKKTELALVDHNYQLTKTVKATCTTDGYKEYTCSMCNKSYQEKLPKTGHNYQVSKKVDATCTADGYDVYTCSNCKDTYTKTTQQKLGHDFSKKIDHKDSTCTVKGFDLYQCSRCNETKKTELALVDHNYQLTKTVKATCTADGYKEYTCSMCNKSYQEKLPKTGHDYDMNTEVERVDSTCSTHGHVNYACKVCGDIKTVKLDLNPENHSYTETGRDLQYIYYKCSECGAEKKEFNDQEYTIDLGNGKTTTVVGHFDLEMRDKILEIINEKRGRFEIPLLSLPGDATPLQDAANTRAIEITYSYSHTRPNGNRAITDLYAYAHTDAENLAKGQQSAEQVCNDWFSSDTHNRNIVNRSYRTIGISVFCQKLAEDDYVNNFSQLFSTLEHY